MRRVACIWACGLERGGGWCETKGRMSGGAGWDYVRSATEGAEVVFGCFIDPRGRESSEFGVRNILGVAVGTVNDGDNRVPTRFCAAGTIG